MRRFLLIFPILLVGCCEPKVIVQTKMVFPELSPISEPSLSLQHCSWDMPRDLNRPNNPIVESNIYIGVDKNNWNCYQLNQVEIRSTLQSYKDRIDAINSQRSDWLLKNKLP